MPAPSRVQLNEKVRWVARALHDPPLFEQRAEGVAEEFGAEAIDVLAGLFHSEHTPPPDLKPLFPGLSDWLSARQFAIFEIFYYLREAALPVLREVAYGEHDWTQGNAIEILCRFAAEGIDRAGIVKELKARLPDISEDTHFYALGPLMDRVKQNTAIQDVLNELLVVPSFRRSYEHMQSQGY
jgi:hypothetical protein